ncbi:MAG TPA: XrtA/PEP-CTERM system histidine kinase PrsK [Verrucomicrobiae bacterium]
MAAFVSGTLAFVFGWRERGTAHRSFAAGMFVLAMESLVNGIAARPVILDEKIFWERCSLLAQAFLPGIWLFFSLSYGRGNYREFLHRWRFALGLFFLLPLGLVFIWRDKLIIGAALAANGHWMLSLGEAGLALNLVFLAGAIVVLMNLERTFRAAVGTMRWRIKFIIIGLGVLFGVRCYAASQVLLFHAMDLSVQAVNAVALLAASGLIFRSLWRANHFDVDIYPSHSILQNSLTVVLAGVYLLVIGIFANVVASLGGDDAFTIKAFFVLVAIVLLTVLLLSDRIRLQTGRFVSRHFQRPQYDYRAVWRKFTGSTAACVGQRELCQATMKLATDVFHALSVTVWLADEKNEELNFATSTFLSEAQAREMRLEKETVSKIFEALEKLPEPVNLDLSRQPWAVALRGIHPETFSEGGHRICVPLSVSGELLGLMILGDRIGGIPFSGQDFDLLKCVGDEIAASLLAARLSQKLLQAKELEAFQTMSAFFVHDLKNAASTLNLMLQNLPAHLDDPAFREDALRGVSKTCGHINRLVERLSLLRNELKIRPVEGDLNQWISKTLADFENNSGVNLVKEFKPLPKVPFDPEQLFKVLTNLALNAREASPRDAEIRVGTQQVNGWAILSVSDHGCGMKPEFLNRSLFRPFQTTKKNGLGIGMFQSKMIVEAHRGKIEVQSEPGKGTTFKIFLPVKK